MTADELQKWGMALILKIHIITGWTIPADPGLCSILVEQYVKYMSERYEQLNPDEIEYAFRSFGTTVEDWGKAINLNLIDKVLIPYLNDRFKLSETERRLKEPNPPQKIFTQEELDNSAREDAELQYQRFLSRQELKSLEICKAILLKDSLIKEDELVIDFFKRKVTAGFLNIYKQS